MFGFGQDPEATSNSSGQFDPFSFGKDMFKNIEETTSNGLQKLGLPQSFGEAKDRLLNQPRQDEPVGIPGGFNPSQAPNPPAVTFPSMSSIAPPNNISEGTRGGYGAITHAGKGGGSDGMAEALMSFLSMFA